MAPDDDHQIACFKTNMTENKEQQWATFPVRSKRSWCNSKKKGRFTFKKYEDRQMKRKESEKM